MAALVTVIAEGKDVACVRCGAVWAGPFASASVAERVATNMNADPGYRPPAQTRVGQGPCCLPQPWTGEPSPADWQARVVVPVLPRPATDADRPAWVKAGLLGAGIASLVGSAPGGLLALVAGPGVLLATLAGVGWLVLGDAASGMVGLLVSLTLVALVLLAIGSGVWFLTWASRTERDTSGETLEDTFQPVGYVGDRVKR